MTSELKSKISDEYDGSTRKLYLVQCKACQIDLWRPKKAIKEENFCSRPCHKIYREKTGKRIELSCSYCSVKFKRFQHHAAQVESKIYFCSRDCQSKAATKEKGFCKNCNSKLKGKSKVYCSHDCQWNFEYKSNIELWKAGKIEGINAGEGIKPWLRRYLFDKYDSSCTNEDCKWGKINVTTGKIPLQVEHIDGDYKNNAESNLTLLCPNCHSLTSTYGALNKGHGREKRRLKLQGKL